MIHALAKQDVNLAIGPVTTKNVRSGISPSEGAGLVFILLTNARFTCPVTQKPVFSASPG